jgi:hypothetical protein
MKIYYLKKEFNLDFEGYAMIPIENEIDWQDIAFFYSASHCIDAGNICKEILRNYSDEQLKEKGKKARQIWLKWLNRERINELVKYLAEKHLMKLRGVYG